MDHKVIVGSLSETTKGRFEWKIPEFTHFNFQRAVHGPSYSPSLTFMNRSLSLFICESYNYFSVCLDYESEYLCNVGATVSFSIKKNDGTLFGTKFAAFTRNSKPNVSRFIRSSVLRIKQFELLSERTLTIVCDLKIQLDVEETLSAAEEAHDMKKAVIEVSEHMKLTETDLLSQNLKDLLSNQDGCDAVLLVQGKEFKVHKSILIARSPVFSAMFRHDTAEKEFGKVVIPDCDPDSFQKFLEYLYCGRLKNLISDSALHLYYTSDKYDLQELKAFCTKYLIHNLTLQNACDVVSLADKYDEMSLLSAVQDFFNKNLEEILTTSEWLNLLKRDFRLANKLLVAMSKAKK